MLFNNMEILFLGTASMVPTKERNHNGILIRQGNETVLVDCGEGIQRQLMIVGAKMNKITKILISHWHGDHVLGLPGLIQSMSASGYNGKLQIYGPNKTKTFMKRMFEVFAFDNKIDLEIIEVARGKFFEGNDLILEAAQLDHNIPTVGYGLTENDKRKIDVKYVKKIGIPEGPLWGKLQKGKTVVWKSKKIYARDATILVPGKRLVIISDTLPCKSAVTLAKNSDLVICESTYSSDLEEKGKEHMHMTSGQAGMLAKKAKVGKLILTHFSARYKDTGELETDAKKYFKNVTCAKDFMEIKL
jgi:ribonuclease Z